MRFTEKEKELFFSKEQLAYLEYKEKIGGEPIGYTVPYGYPSGVEERGGVIAIYKECIKRGITWEELLDYESDEEGIEV